LLLQVVFEQPDASCAGNAANQKLSFLAAFNGRNKGLLNQRMIQFPEPIEFGAG